MRSNLLRGQTSYRFFSSTSGRRKDVVDLAYTRHDPAKKGKSSNPIILMHGLFGSQRNNRTFILAQQLSRPVYTIDLRNHGASPHHPVHNYTVLSEDVEHLLRTNPEFTQSSNQHDATSKKQKPILIGHSMGAKVAMTLALRSPQSYAGIVPIDNAPIDAALKSDFGTYVNAMLEVERPPGVNKQSDADKILAKYEKDVSIRQFLLTNLVKDPDSNKDNGTENTSPRMKFRVPLQTLSKSLNAMADFPYKNPDEARYEGPTLVIRGGESRYVADETLPVMGRFFPRFELVDVPGAGHWVIAEKFEVCVDAVVEWVRRVVDGDG